MSHHSFKKLYPTPTSPDSSGIAAWLNLTGFQNLSGFVRLEAAIRTDSRPFHCDERQTFRSK